MGTEDNLRFVYRSVIMMNQDVTERLNLSYTRLITETDVVILPSVNFFNSLEKIHSVECFRNAPAMSSPAVVRAFKQFILESRFITSATHS